MRQSGQYFYRILLSLLLAGCGKGYEELSIQNEVVADGQYHAQLLPLNVQVGKSKGFSSISIKDNQFWARVKIFGPKTGSMHAQYIHRLDRCPTHRDDTNGDGFLDAWEVFAVSGEILIPLDSDLNSQIKGMNEFPRMKKHDFFYYSEACHSDRLLRDLRSPDELRYDFITKLSKTESLNLSGRVIVVYGTSETRKLPDSVRSFSGYSTQQSLPIACGEILNGESSEFSRGNMISEF